MKSPSMLPKTDQPIDIDENNKVVSYSNSYWSAEIPWNKMKVVCHYILKTKTAT